MRSKDQKELVSKYLGVESSLRTHRNTDETSVEGQSLVLSGGTVGGGEPLLWPPLQERLLDHPSSLK